MLNVSKILAAALLAPLLATSAVALSHIAVDEGQYLPETAAAMTRMMTDMDVAPTGDVDRDFVAMMIPHHRGAIEMATAMLRHGSNEQLKRIAQEIIIEQQQEIAAMQLALGQILPPQAPTHGGHATPSVHLMER